MMFQYPRWILCGVTGFGVLMAGVVAPGGVHPPVWPVAGCVVYWVGRCFVGGNAEVVVGLAAFAVGCEVVVAGNKKK